MAPVTGLTSFAAGAYVIDMGQATQTVANSLKPYGMVYDLVENQHIPVDWAINPNKAVFGADFTAGGKSYSGGSFIIEAPFAAAAQSTIAKWQAQGVVVNQISTSFVAPIYNTITAFPRTVLDLANGKIAQAYYAAAGIPQFASPANHDPTKAAYVFGTPLDLSQCNDVYVLPHADPSQWPASYKNALVNFVNQGGWLYQACHSVSDLAVNVTNFLSTGLILYKSHSNGTPPYNYNPTTAADPEMQFTTRIDAATQNGSEQIYVPSATGAWLPTTHVGVYDPTQANASGTTVSKSAAVLAYGPAYGSSTAGWVMYEGGHSLAGTSPANVGAMRAFFDFILQAGIAHTPQFTGSSFPPTLTPGGSGTVSATVALGSMKIVSYQWTSTNGGTFTNQTAVTDPATGAVTITATFTAATLPTNITLTVNDDCGHQTILQHQILAAPPPANQPPVARNDAYTTPQDKTLIVSTAATSLLNNDSDPNGDPLIVSNFDRTSINGGTVAVNPDGTFTYTPKAGFSGTDTFTYTIADGKGGTASATATITVTPTPPPVPAAPPSAKDDKYGTDSTTPILGQNILGNDTLNFATITGLSNFKNTLVQWDGNPATVPPPGTPYFLLNQATGILNFYPNGYTRADPSFDYTLTNIRGNDKATVSFHIDTNSPQANEDFATVAGYPTGQTPTSVIIPISDNDVDPDPNFRGWAQPTISGVPNGATAVAVQIGTNELDQPVWGIQYTPAPNHFTGTGPQDTFNYSVKELVFDPPSGTIKTGKTTSTSDFVNVTNQVQAVADLYTVPEDSGPTSLTVLANDVAQGSPITIKSVNVPNGITANGGSVYISDDGLTVIYQPAHNFSGTDGFTYTIIDGNGSTSTATVTVNVPPTPNRPPVAVADTNDPIPNDNTFPVGDSVTENDSDPDNDPITVTTIADSVAGTVPVPANPTSSATILGQFGTLVIGPGGSYTYQVNTANPAVVGLPIDGTINDVFTYTISDGNGGTSSTTLTIPITRFDKPPVAVDDAYTTGAGTVLTVPAAQGVLANDHDPDPEDLGKLTVVGVNANPAAVGQPITLPSGAIVTVNPDGSFAYNPNHVFDGLAPGTTGTDSFTYAVTDSHGMVSTATAVITITPPMADLALAKTVSNARPNVGDTITFTVTLTDQGPDAATGVTVQDLLPAGLTYVSSAPSQGTYDPVSGIWTVGAVDTSAPRTLMLTARVVSSAPRTNTATISHSDQIDPVGTDNTASATETPLRSDLVVSKSVDAAHPNVGDTITYLVTVTDAGPDAATNVQLTDLLPAGLTLLSNTPSQGTYNATTGLWSVGTLASGGNATLQLRAMVVSPAAQTNTAAISHSDQFDPNTGNNSASATETPQQADLAILKSVSDSKPNNGDTITYTLRVVNTGPDTATGVFVTDVLPAGLTFVSSSATQGAYDDATGIWTVGTVAPAATATLTIYVTVDKQNTIVNTATVAGDQFDPDPGNNTDSISFKAKEADLLVLKTVSDPTPNVGENVTFTVAVANGGPDTATGVQVTDVLPTGLTFVSDTPSQGTYDNVTGLWDVGTVAPGPSAQTLAIVARVVSTAAQTNTATITAGDQFDPNLANNSNSATESPQGIDLAVTKNVSDATPNVGDTITFTVTLANSGPNTATGVVLTDLLPAGLSFVSSTPSQGSYNPINGLWSVGTVATGAPETLTLSARVDSPIAQTNTASVTRADQFDPNTANDSASATETPQRADLALTKSVSDPTPHVGDQIIFTVTLSNAGPDTATGVSVSDLLPAGLTFVSATPSTGNYNNVSGVWTVGTVTTTTPQTLRIVAMVASPNPRTNTATITAVDQFDPNQANDTASATETPQRADLSLTKSVSDATPNVGERITFTVTLTNNGPSDATGVQVTDLLPAGLTFVTATPSQGTYTPGTGLWDVGAVADAGSATLTITATVVGSAAQTNTAAISHSDQFDPNTGNNTASATETPQRADLVITKGVSNSTPNVGDTITYTLAVANSGPDTATGVIVTDLLPAGVTFVSDIPSQGAYDEVTGVWTVGTVAAAATPTLTITVTVSSPGQIVNTATVDGDQFDPNLGNNTDSTSADPQEADLAIVKTVNDPTPNVGDQITFTVTLTNNGPNTATGVQVTDLLPAGVTFVSSNPSQGTYTPGSGVWTVGTITPGTPQTLAIVATVVSSAAQTNTATVTAADQFDPNTGNNSASATETPQQADLALTKTVSNPTPNVGDTVTFTVTLTNAGPDAATGVQVTDLLPAGLTYVSDNPSQGIYDPASGVWTVGTVSPGVPQTLTITATVVSPAAQTNTATVTHSDQFDPKTANNTASATETPQQADLAVTKTVSDATPNVGDTITFTVTISNAGPTNATGVERDRPAAAGLTFVSRS